MPLPTKASGLLRQKAAHGQSLLGLMFTLPAPYKQHKLPSECLHPANQCLALFRGQTPVPHQGTSLTQKEKSLPTASWGISQEPWAVLVQ